MIKKAIHLLRRLIAKPLINQLPAPHPLSMHIDPCNICNFKCIFCPTSDTDLLKKVNRPAKIMEFETFTKVIDDLVALLEPTSGKLNNLHLYKDGEPFLNKDLFKMVCYSKEKNVARVVQTTTNGTLLEERLDEILKSKLDMIRISVEHINEENYYRITRTKDAFQKVKKGVQKLYEKKIRQNPNLQVVVKINDTNLTEDEKNMFYNDFGNISDVIRIDTLMGWSYSDMKDFTLGINVKKGMDSITPLKEKKICPEPFYTLAVNSDGSVSVCCVDWSYKTKVGDVNKQTLKEIWNSDELNKFRCLHIKGRRNEIEPCANCQFLLGFNKLSTLDKFATKLLKIYNLNNNY